MKLGEEPGLSSELHQPLGRNTPYFLSAKVSYIEPQINTFEDDVKITQTLSNEFGATPALGKEIGNWGDFRFGLNRFRARNDIEFGNPVGFTGKFDGGELFLSGKLDTLDSLSFPTEGTRSSLKFTNSDANFGSDFEFDQIQLDVINAST